MKRLNIPDPIDLLAIFGALMLAIGAGLIYLPAAFVVVGVLVLAYAVMASRHEPPSDPEVPA